MRIYNLTNSQLRISIGNGSTTIEPRTASSGIILTPGMVKSALLPLINMYGTEILVVPNTSDINVLDQPGCGIPAENVVDLPDADKALKNCINEYNKKVKNANKPQNQNKTEPKEEKIESKVEQGPVPSKTDPSLVNPETEAPSVPPIQVIKGNKK